jgi:hypothetical protein
MENSWQRLVMTPSSKYFPIVQDEMKKAKVDSGNNLEVKLINKQRSQLLKHECKEKLMLVFDWQSPEVCGVEVFRRIEE